MIRAVWNFTIIAETDDAIEADGHMYFPPESIEKKVFTKSETTSTDPWLGKAEYYNVTVLGQTNRDAAWYYPEPPESAKAIKNHVTFAKNVYREGGEPKSKLERP